MKVSYKLDLSELPRLTRKMQDELYDDLKVIVEAATSQASMQAKQNVKVDKAGLKSSILALHKGLTGEVRVGAEYGPYLDFGTGSEIQIPSDWQEVAIQFKGAGIREVNNRAQPFFYPAIDRHIHRFQIACDKALERVMNKRR